jgi:hypothetical protein
MPTLEDIAQHIMKVAADPARLQAEASESRIQRSPPRKPVALL